MSKCKICRTSHTRDELDDRGCCRGCDCFSCPLERFCNEVFRTETDWFDWLRSPVEESAE